MALCHIGRHQYYQWHGMADGGLLQISGAQELYVTPRTQYHHQRFSTLPDSLPRHHYGPTLNHYAQDVPIIIIVINGKNREILLLLYCIRFHSFSKALTILLEDF